MDSNVDVATDSMAEKLESLVQRIDVYEAESRRRDDQLGAQMNWLCEKLQSLFLFVDQAGKHGGGIRGMMQVLRSAPPELINSDVREVPNE